MLAGLTLVALLALGGGGGGGDAHPVPLPGSFMVGSTFDGTQLPGFAGQVYPKQPAFQWSYCEERCIAMPAPAGCPEECAFRIAGNRDTTFAVPRELDVQTHTMGEACYENQQFSSVQEYTDYTVHVHSHHGWFSSHSSRTEKFYNRYFEHDDSMSLMYRKLSYYDVEVLEILAELHPDFKGAVANLPATNTTSARDAYRSFVNAYGTHYMHRARMGGMLLQESFFHSCLLMQYKSQSVYEQSSSSFLGIIHDDKDSGKGSNITNAMWQKWSSQNVTMIGGFTDKFPVPTRDEPWEKGTLQDWMDTVKFSPLPVQYEVRPLTDLIDDKAKVALLTDAIMDYSAEVRRMNKDAASEFAKKDPFTKPSWCTYGGGPHPPTGYVPDPVVTRDDLPGCPSW